MDEFVIVKSPLLETLLMCGDFYKYAQQVDTLELILKYGNKAFLVDKEWITKISGKA